jgi:hypothetical protein
MGVALALVGSAGRVDDSHDRLPDAASSLLDGADAIELISIDPRDRPARPEEGFHGWKILGRTTLREGEARRAIVAAVRRGVAEADGASGCFEPRHGLRASKGHDSADLVICFSCRWIEVHVGGKTASVWTTDAAKSPLNRALRDAGLPLAQDVQGP